MRHTSLALVIAIASSVWLAAAAPARAGDAPYAQAPLREVAVRIGDQDYAFGYRPYPEPVVLDLARADRYLRRGTFDAQCDVLGFEQPVAKRHPASRCRAGGVLFGFQLGTWFSVAMVGLAGGAILYDTSNILRRFPQDRYVAAALQLFSSVALMFWYVLRIFIGSRN